jgi:hypothetical protein
MGPPLEKRSGQLDQGKRAMRAYYPKVVGTSKIGKAIIVLNWMKGRH